MINTGGSAEEKKLQHLQQIWPTAHPGITVTAEQRLEINLHSI